MNRPEMSLNDYNFVGQDKTYILTTKNQSHPQNRFLLGLDVGFLPTV